MVVLFGAASEARPRPAQGGGAGCAAPARPAPPPRARPCSRTRRTCAGAGTPRAVPRVAEVGAADADHDPRAQAAGRRLVDPCAPGRPAASDAAGQEPAAAVRDHAWPGRPRAGATAGLVLFVPGLAWMAAFSLPGYMSWRSRRRGGPAGARPTPPPTRPQRYRRCRWPRRGCGPWRPVGPSCRPPQPATASSWTRPGVSRPAAVSASQARVELRSAATPYARAGRRRRPRRAHAGLGPGTPSSSGPPPGRAHPRAAGWCCRAACRGSALRMAVKYWESERNRPRDARRCLRQSPAQRAGAGP